MKKAKKVKYLFSIILLFVLFTASSQIYYNHEKDVDIELPDVLLCLDGTIVKTQEQWEKKRRPELLRMFRHYMYGKSPSFFKMGKFKVLKIEKNAFAGRAIRKDIRIWPVKDHPQYYFDVFMYLPKLASTRPVPVFLSPSYMPSQTVCHDETLELPVYRLHGESVEYQRGEKDHFWNISKMLDKGFGLITFWHQELVADTETDFISGFPSLYYKKGQYRPYPDEWGCISLWAWQMSIVMNYLVTDNNVDNKKVVVLGHSRFGKAALWAAAQDERFPS